MSRLATTVRVTLFCLFATIAHAEPAANARAPVRVIEPGELTLLSYTVVQRLWTGTWRSAFWTTTHDTSDAAITMLTREAEKDRGFRPRAISAPGWQSSSGNYR